MLKRNLWITGIAIVLSLVVSGMVIAADDTIWEKTAGGVTVNMGVLPSNNPTLVCWKHHSKEKGVSDIRKETTHHLLFVFRDAKTGKLVEPETVAVKIYAPSGDVVAHEQLDKEIYAGIVNFCDFFDLTQEGTYMIELKFVKGGKTYNLNFYM